MAFFEHDPIDDVLHLLTEVGLDVTVMDVDDWSKLIDASERISAILREMRQRPVTEMLVVDFVARVAMDWNGDGKKT